MAPNVLLAAKKATCPWEWRIFSSKDQPGKHQRLYFGQQPIKGIYSVAANNKHYLVAIKPNRSPDVDGIFRKNTRKNICQRTPFVDSNTKSGNEGAVTPGQETATEARSMTYDGNSKASEISIKSRLTESANGDSKTSNSTKSSTSISFVQSPVVQPNKEIHTVEYTLNKKGTFPHQKSPSSKETKGYRRRFMSPPLATIAKPNSQKNNTTRKTTGVQKIDLNGYRFLAKPLEIEFNAITNRLMFRAEVEARKAVGLLCRTTKCECQGKGGATCGNTVRKEMFVLDDSLSWIVLERERKHPYKEGEALYMIDEYGEGMMRQSAREARCSEIRIQMMKGKFVVAEDEDRYALLLKYLGLEFGSLDI
ncbi:uncharacterized protein L3040_002402 [Drepanopeziza brunnea f. sp. 'multigermtubi']|uniref:Uncharacterized protein n=1 Tax=Marssonina brunnea f. sp. multigermtubi (strain MB_m1) TaxID=1072389 RepID=K1X4C7_MARBU|nr:uncharacterized protein MBM_01869 [Drepanopeziza brunnea f. sp. 'multigermtubi' MB_m1]EKD19917.1 hypothetical protein MBM_01869 [Drepanopeziza brunnea f. sp. 'multigermtubi' MB_m1]KAJ5050524.1 hypothetical protein L3040_002402 [Drepanopeziza brunnea f. sp. 'multigermtubi']